MAENYFYFLLLAVNLAGFVMTWSDKNKARRRRRRIPERNFFLLGLCGGAFGIYLGMRLFRHKTQHWRFVYGIPLLFLLNLAVIYVVFYRL